MVNPDFHFGAIIKMDFTPQAGHEQAGWRPAIIISSDMLNRHSNMIMVCPITHTNRINPFHIEVKGTEKTDGFILCEQAKMTDVYARGAEFIEDAPKEIAQEARTIVKQFLED